MAGESSVIFILTDPPVPAETSGQRRLAVAIIFLRTAFASATASSLLGCNPVEISTPRTRTTPRQRLPLNSALARNVRSSADSAIWPAQVGNLNVLRHA